MAKNKHIVDKFIEFTARDSIFNVNLLYDYIYKSKKVVLWLCRLTNLKNSKYKYFSDTLWVQRWESASFIGGLKLEKLS